ncbi:MAG TPA: SRPBCC family protein [Nocardioides sp.]|mgnify:CR=1 FL=1|uniref:SRPBCC family protein n=1 Tax=uncultured Nocardioides sp. TaxID=198441 RepID=UPI000EDF6EED|nr:SRPBCC family protein [uncultured Nocardioides sp.]HCB07035.1 carbon monoxide dehydrogenase [Nocardioides sp.]HRD62277.1 SRPBCC family protein [Nocardioides sp.]HRI96248.1 SRPBCC family protein [Nocardioides sp.]HRK46848.1 SRPBCC family protein [Nocardioides sp.]
MLVTNTFEVAQPPDKVWDFVQDVPNVAACLPGAEITDDLGDDEYAGRVNLRMGPVKLEFAGKAHVVERDHADQRVAIDASGSDRRGRGNVEMTVTARLAPGSGGGTKVTVDQDLQISGAAAQYGRGMITDVTAVLMKQFATNMQQRIEATERGESTDHLDRREASGLAIGIRAAQMALVRVFRRFFLPYDPTQFPSRGGA